MGGYNWVNNCGYNWVNNCGYYWVNNCDSEWVNTYTLHYTCSFSSNGLSIRFLQSIFHAIGDMYMHIITCMYIYVYIYTYDII